MFNRFGLKAVGMNSRGGKCVTVWWVALHNSESLKDFLEYVEGLEIDGTRLKVVLTTGLESTSKLGNNAPSAML